MTISPKNRPKLIIMTKEPIAGQVKTRLGKDIGPVAAAWWYRHQLSSLVRQVSSPKWDTMFALAPDQAIRTRMLPNIARISQGRGDLGARMKRLLTAPRSGPVVLIGADIPDVNRQRIGEVFAGLGSHDIAFGPATDGGFWAVGARCTHRLPPRIFRNVRWSTADALSDALTTLSNCSVTFGATLRDVDCAADLAFTTDLKRRPC
ncbi:MAG: TIGR04282 family arsenosugar biosynthesis glycosyltransferase [Maritimibacter sp.]